MVGQERNQRGQEAVGLRLAIDALDDLSLRQTETLQELRAQCRRQLPLQHIAHQQAAQHGTAAFVAQDPAQGRRLAGYVAAVVEAGIGPRAEDAGDTLRVAT